MGKGSTSEKTRKIVKKEINSLLVGTRSREAGFHSKRRCEGQEISGRKSQCFGGNEK